MHFLRARLFRLGGDGFQARHASRADEQLRAFSAERARRRCAEAARRAGDEDPLAG